MSENVIIAVISALSGGVIGQFLNYLLSSKKQHSDNYGSVLSLWKEDNERLRKIESDLRSQVDELKDLVGDLSNKVVLLESAHLSFPFPMWLKGLDGTMLVLNRSYERVFLEPKGLTARDYVGFDDLKVWGAEIAANFKKNDLMAYNSENGFVRVVEDVEGVKYVVVKYVRRWDRTVIGIGGVAIKIDDLIS